MFAAGASITTIASRLGVSVKTISTYRRRLLDKLELAHNAALNRAPDSLQPGPAARHVAGVLYRSVLDTSPECSTAVFRTSMRH